MPGVVVMVFNNWQVRCVCVYVGTRQSQSEGVWLARLAKAGSATGFSAQRTTLITKWAFHV